MESSEVDMDSVVGSEGAISDRSPPTSLDNGMIIASDAVNAADHGIQIGVEAHEQAVMEIYGRGIVAASGRRRHRGGRLSFSTDLGSDLAGRAGQLPEGGREEAGRQKGKGTEAVGAVLFGWRKRL
ncbi:hypothetical protein OIU77_003039 [Salix suchowensis]|uniref:Uncharacterized protein n=1 Tax=Salix suchowensis TaxID=1278906 RepID=A0ABQ9AY84_9ROSI|nr:hypothetical protein OIU77_003039 [Salix suchowensis]